MKVKLSVVIPAYNEEQNLPTLLDSVVDFARNKRWDYELLIVDDNSSDKTPEISDFFAGKYPEIRVIHRTNGNNGMGASLREGTIAANGMFVVWLMADRSDNLDTIQEILNELGEGHDMVFASRYMKGGSSGDLSTFKAFLSSRFTIMARIAFGLAVHDITNAFRGFRRDIFSVIVPESNDFAISPELAIKAHLRGFKLGEVPTIYHDRKSGTSKFKIVPMVTKYLSLLVRHRLWKYTSAL